MNERSLIVPIGISARHIHLSKADAEILFGPGVDLTPVPGTEGRVQYPAIERVAMHSPKASFPRVAVMLPLYKDFTQIEISMSDARVLGLEAPIRMSRDIAGSPGVKLTGPRGEVVLTEGVIIAKRHIHINEDWANELGLTQRKSIKLQIVSAERSLVFDDVMLRIEKKQESAEVHIDVDEANAAGISGAVEGTMIL